MKYLWITLSVLVMFLLLTTTSCNKSSLIGSDILPAEDNVNVLFTDTLTLVTTTNAGVVPRVFDPNPSLQPVNYLLGRVNDPVFGTYESKIYSQLELLVTGPDFSNTKLDSIVLTLGYSSGGHYGNLDAPFRLDVFEVIEDMDPDTIRDYYSNETFEVNHDPIGSLTFNPRPTDSLVVDGVLFPPHVRIPLNPSLGERFLDSMQYGDAYQDDFSFTQFFKGIGLKGFLSNEAIIGFDLNSPLSLVTMYYTQNDTDRLAFSYVIKSNSIKTMNFEHNYAPTFIPNILGDPVHGDSLVYLQSMEGLDTKIEIPYITDLGKIVVNKAELIVTVADNTDLDLYPLPSQLILTETNATGDGQVLIEDVVVSASRTDGGIQALFGGAFEESNGKTQYTMNLTGHFQDVVDGILDNNALYINTFPKTSIPNRVILGGANNSNFGMEFKLIYTKLD